MRKMLASALLCLCAGTAGAVNLPFGQVPNPTMVPLTPCRLDVSTPSLTAVGCTSGTAGLLFEVDASSGSAGDACLGLDSATVSGITATTTNKAITPEVLSTGLAGSSAATACTSQAICGSWRPNGNAAFTNGLVAIKRSTGVTCTFWYLLQQ